ncbi:MAG: DNA-binding protein [Flavobacteriales bacterium CG_4_9_14_3_um_filter_40_17]|nr:MAG: DNA-binding protein [Flavobacteriales bacterium CG_4_9_14_3_um_filter_40_17]
MNDNENNERNDREEIYSKVLRAGRRTYFFDVRSTRAGDYYLTLTESKKFTHDDGSFHYQKHKIYLYKEDFESFTEHLKEMTDFVYNEKGEEVISERHQKDFKKDELSVNGFDENIQDQSEIEIESPKSFTDIKFEDI